MTDEYKIINAEHITDPQNPNRIEIKKEELQDLADSIKTVGLQEPLIVRQQGDKFEVVAGHRRFKACLLAGVINIPCIVRQLTDDQAEDVKAHENMFRQDLDPLEEAMYLARLVGEDDTKIPEVARRLSKSEQWVFDRLQLLSYPDYLQRHVRNGVIGLGVAQWLSCIEDETYRKMFVDQAAANGMTVRWAEYLYRQWELGLLKESTSFMPPLEADGSRKEFIFKAPCAKCGLEAVDPNIQSVLIHKVCPGNEVGKGEPTI